MVAKYSARSALNKIAAWKMVALIVKDAQIQKLDPIIGKVNIVETYKVEESKICEYDKKHITRGLDRGFWLKKWLNHPAGWARVSLNEANEIDGFAVARIVLADRLVIGPVYADGKSSAAALVRALIFESKVRPTTKEIHFFIPSSNWEMFDLIATLSEGHFEGGGYLVSQFLQYLPDINMQKVFAIAEYAISYI